MTNCGQKKEPFPLIVPVEGISLPEISGLAWLDSDAYPGGRSFVSVSSNGFISVWDMLNGQFAHYNQGEELSGLTDFDPNTNTAFPVLSPDGTKKISPSGDGGIILYDAGSDKELARYYSLGSGEWVSIVPAGFYNASFHGSEMMELKSAKRKYTLDKLSGALYRPDLFRAQLLSPESKGKESPNLEALFNDEIAPPLVSVLSDKDSLLKGVIHLVITEQKGGIGLLALYKRLNGEEIPSGLLDAKKTAEREYSEKGRTCYELTLTIDSLPESGSLGLSAFNKNNTIESERLWIEIPGRTAGQTAAGVKPDAQPSPAPALRALIAGTDEQTETLGEFLSPQAEGELYSGVELYNLQGGKFSKENIVKACEELAANAGRNDVTVIYIEGQGHASPMGDLYITTEQTGEEYINSYEILKPLLGLGPNTILLLDLAYKDPWEQMETALLRFRQRLGPKAMLAGNSIVQPVLLALGSGEGKRFASAADLLSRSGVSLAEQGGAYLAFSPAEDFWLADPFINAGELKFQTMTSGMLKIDRVDANPVPLVFGDTMIRALPPGNYIIDMIYRNGYRETRFVDLKNKDSLWVIFTYTPALLTGTSLNSLPLNGINIAELNPVNYQKINREAMEGMGMAPYYVAFLAGEKFYKDGKIDEAITEYNRALSLNPGYAEALVSRGNAQRRKGNFENAIADYSRALNLKNDYAEVYNYRGYAYAQKGDLARAVADYTQAIRHKADYADAWFNRAYAYGRQGSWDEAIADYTQLIKLEPSNGIAYNERGNAWSRKGDEAKAEADYEAAKKLNPGL